MRKRIAKSLVAAMLVTTITGTTVFADEVTDLTNQKSEAQSELDNLQTELAYLLVQIDELESKMYAKNDEIEQANKDLEEAEKNMESQYEDMKLRIKYMYEDQSVSITEAFLTADNMSDALNKAEYVQQVYDYDRDKLDEMAATAARIKEIKENLENDKKELESLGEEMTKKQALLYTTIADQESKVEDLASQLTAAQERAAAAQAEREAAARAAQAASVSSGSTSTYSASSNTSKANNNSSVASSVVSLAYSLRGIPYVWGGKSPSTGFDCSGFLYYIFGQNGVYVTPSSSAIAVGGASVGSLSEAQPGDIICYPGHVGLYIGNGQIIHAPTTGDVVKISSVNIMTITAIRRYW
jgi:cell wall-associated NlpC family hydrolase